MKQIADVVDIERYPWVVPQSWLINTRYGQEHLPRGFLMDGATGFMIRDLEPEAFGPHDRLYVYPVIGGRRLNRIQCDLLYGSILMKRWRILSAVARPLGLIIIPKSWSIWREYRRREEENPDWWLTKLFVPHNAEWQFPNWHTKDAIWVGV